MRLIAALLAWVVVAATAIALVLPRHGTAALVRQTPPNILLIQADDLGYGDLSAYGQARFRTPQLDGIAARGIRFTQYYAGSTVCAPSRTALMTGQHTGHAWVRGNGEIPLRDEDVTLAMVLKSAGYRTAVIGKWGLGGPGTTGQPDRKGFEYSFGFLDHRHAHRQFTDHLFRNASRVATDVGNDYVNDLFTAETRAFIEREDSRPFFVYLNYTVPHAELRLPATRREDGGRSFPEAKPFTNPKADARATGWTDVSHWLSIAAGAARRVRRDDRADGPRHRQSRGNDSRARSGEPHAGHVRQRQRAASGRRRRSGVLQEHRRAAWHQTRPV